MFVGYYYVVASYENWHGQSAFGNRFFVSLTPCSSWGSPKFWRVASKFPFVGRRPRLACTLLLAPLIFWNVGLMFQWGTGLVPNRGPVDFRVATRNQATRVGSGSWPLPRSFLMDREQVTRAVEHGDLERAGEYRPRR